MSQIRLQFIKIQYFLLLKNGSLIREGLKDLILHSLRTIRMKTFHEHPKQGNKLPKKFAVM